MNTDISITTPITNLKLIEKVRIQDKRGIVKLQDGKEFHIKVLNKTSRELDLLDLEDWEDLAIKTLTVIQKKNLLSNPRQIRSFSGATVDHRGVIQKNHSFTHEQITNTQEDWKILEKTLNTLNSWQESQTILPAGEAKIAKAVDQMMPKEGQNLTNHLKTVTTASIDSKIKSLHQELKSEDHPNLFLETLETFFRSDLITSLIQQRKAEIDTAVQKSVENLTPPSNIDSLTQKIIQELSVENESSCDREILETMNAQLKEETIKEKIEEAIAALPPKKPGFLENYKSWIPFYRFYRAKD